MNDDFDQSWNHIQRALPVDASIRVWSYASGYGLHNTFRIEAVEPTAITVSSDGTTLPRRISKGEFAKVQARWADYCAGHYPRHLLRDESQNSTYILGILRWLEVEAPSVSTG